MNKKTRRKAGFFIVKYFHIPIYSNKPLKRFILIFFGKPTIKIVDCFKY